MLTTLRWSSGSTVWGCVSVVGVLHSVCAGAGLLCDRAGPERVSAGARGLAADMIVFFARRMKMVAKSKLLKLLRYSDFLAYRRRFKSTIGMVYCRNCYRERVTGLQRGLPKDARDISGP